MTEGGGGATRRQYDRSVSELRVPSPAAPLERVPAGALVIGSILSVQFGAAVAATLFASVGAAGAASLRVLLGTLILLAAWRPSLRGHSRRDLGRIAPSDWYWGYEPDLL